MKAEDLYVGERGAHYFAQRAANRTIENQRKRARFFCDFTQSSHAVLDFGCGTGGVLATLDASHRIGIEISESAVAEAQQVLDEVLSDLSLIRDASVDRIISFHAFEHVDSPRRILGEFQRILKPDGAVRILVPCEMPIFVRHHLGWQPNDDMHLHSWTPLTLGNLLTVSGFDVQRAEMLPGSEGGRLGKLFREGSGIRRLVAYLKSLKSGQFHTAVTATKRRSG
ncbi:class I SAM-dependent methyltransferase [Parvibaculum sp.]|uniref:class I SAM-dependent methyltransferase n=1 Tax=Parvibaculum sp. TaxID=2024848 RepID=UPI002A330BA0|nr:class I SAM-dependent methyltransferase [Parvibaculum sp.]